MGVEFISRQEMKDRIASGSIARDVAVISINDSDKDAIEMAFLCSRGFPYIEILQFQDTEDEGGISNKQAHRLLSFINTNKDRDFLVHCWAGISRSGAVAKFIDEYFSLDDLALKNYALYNKRVFNKLHAAAGTSLAAYYEELEKRDRTNP